MSRAAALLLLATAPALAQGFPWERALPDLAPALVACLRVLAPDGMVVAAAPMNHGLALARVARRDGTRVDCQVELGPPGGAARVAQSLPVAAGALLPGEGQRAFMLERRCVDALRVDAADGQILGWLAYPAC